MRWLRSFALLLALAAAPFASSIPTARAASSACPGAGQPGVYLYSELNYGGRCSFFAFDSKQTGDPNAASWIIGDNNASSMRVIPPTPAQGPSHRVSVSLFLDTNYRNLRHTTGASIADFRIVKGLNNSVSSIRLLDLDADQPILPVK